MTKYSSPRDRLDVPGRFVLLVSAGAAMPAPGYTVPHPGCGPGNGVPIAAAVFEQIAMTGNPAGLGPQPGRSLMADSARSPSSRQGFIEASAPSNFQSSRPSVSAICAEAWSALAVWNAVEGLHAVSGTITGTRRFIWSKDKLESGRPTAALSVSRPT